MDKEFEPPIPIFLSTTLCGIYATLDGYPMGEPEAAHP